MTHSLLKLCKFITSNILPKQTTKNISPDHEDTFQILCCNGRENEENSKDQGFKGNLLKWTQTTCCIEGELIMVDPDLLPLGEIEFRYARCRRLLRTLAPDAGGMLVTSQGLALLFDRERWGGAQYGCPLKGNPFCCFAREWNAHKWNPPCVTFFPSSHIRKSPLSALGAEARFLPSLPWIKTDSTGRWRRCCKAVWKVCGSPPVMPSLLRPEP